MRVTLQMIDPELRLAGLAASALFRPSQRFFRLVRRIDPRTHGSDVPGLECEQRWVDSLDEGVRVRVRTYRPRGVPRGRERRLRVAAVAEAERRRLGRARRSALRDGRERRRRPHRCGVADGAGSRRRPSGSPTSSPSIRCSTTGWSPSRRGTTTRRSGDRDTTGGLAGGDVPKYASPALETNWCDLPPTTAFVGELDPFLDETVAYVEGLRAAGVPVELRSYPRCYHGFDAIRPGAKVSREANEFLCDRFASAVDHDFAKQS